MRAHWSGNAEGTTVVLVHGLGGSHRTWDPVVPALAERHRVLAVDLPGGRAITAEAADLERLLRTASVTRAVVAGHSMGGLVATALAERAPALVAHLLLINTPPTYESRLTARARPEQILRLPVIGAAIWAVLNDGRRRAGLRTAVAPGREVPEPLVADLRDTTHAAFVGSTTATDRYVRLRPLAQRLARLDVSVDILFGERDQRVDPASLAGYDGVANVRVTTISDAGHSPPWEAPDAVIAAVEAAITRTR